MSTPSTTIVTLAFGEIIRIVLLNWYSLTNGPDGITRIPRPTLFGLEFKRFGDNTFANFFGIDYSPLQRIVFLYYVILVLALITNAVTISCNGEYSRLSRAEVAGRLSGDRDARLW